MDSLQQLLHLGSQLGRLFQRKLLQLPEYRRREVHLALLGALSVAPLRPVGAGAGPRFAALAGPLALAIRGPRRVVFFVSSFFPYS